MAQTYYGTGRRKSSVARVYLTKGTGKFTVNNQDLQKYFTRETYHKAALVPVEVTKQDKALNIVCFVKGGGTTGQADAIKLGVSRALLSMDGENRALLRTKKLLTRDPREVERKKYGQRGARARFQYSKR